MIDQLLPYDVYQALINASSPSALNPYLTASSAGAFLPLSGGTMTGPIILNADASSSLEPVTLQQLNAATLGLYDFRGGFDASANLFPATGGSGGGGAILKADVWVITVAGTLGGTPVTPGDQVTALVDTPGQTTGNWNVITHSFGYTPISNVLNSSQILVGSAGNIATPVSMTGDVTISNLGVTSIGAGKVLNTMIANSTIDLTSKVNGVLPSANGGTGVNNGSATITLAGNLITTGGFNTTFVQQATTVLTLPPVTTTIVGKTGTAAQYQIPYYNDANQITTNTLFKTDVTGNLYVKGGSVFLGSQSADYIFWSTGVHYINSTTNFVIKLATVQEHAWGKGWQSITPSAQSSGATPAWQIVTPASLNASSFTDVNAVLYDFTATLQHHAGAIVQQNDFRIKHRTHSFLTTPSTITDAFTQYIDGGPSQGINCTITRSWGLGVNGNTLVNGNMVINSGAIATNATNGFLYIPSCAGTPTGVPTSYSGGIPLVFDSTNKKLYVYSGGSWIGGTVPGAFS